MDNGMGKFERFADMSEAEKLRQTYPKSKGIFTVGEKIEIRGSLFKVTDISPFGIKLKLLPQP